MIWTRLRLAIMYSYTLALFTIGWLSWTPFSHGRWLALLIGFVANFAGGYCLSVTNRQRRERRANNREPS